MSRHIKHLDLSPFQIECLGRALGEYLYQYPHNREDPDIKRLEKGLRDLAQHQHYMLMGWDEDKPF